MPSLPQILFPPFPNQGKPQVFQSSLFHQNREDHFRSISNGDEIPFCGEQASFRNIPPCPSTSLLGLTSRPRITFGLEIAVLVLLAERMCRISLTNNSARKLPNQRQLTSWKGTFPDSHEIPSPVPGTPFVPNPFFFQESRPCRKFN